MNDDHRISDAELDAALGTASDRLDDALAEAVDTDTGLAEIVTRAATPQFVGGRWRLGKQITPRGRERSWRVAYVAEDQFNRDPADISYYAIKRLQPPRRNEEHVYALNEYSSLPIGVEISPYVTPVVGRGYDDEFGWYIVTPHYKRGTLQHLMDSGDSITLGEALTYTEQVLEGLLAAFSFRKMSLVHFDVKPSNIAFDDNGHVKIIDWGLADHAHDSQQGSLGTHTGFTFWYAPPEQVAPQSSSRWKSPLCDIRAVGATLYAVITGRPPLHLEAWHAGLLDDDMDLRLDRRAEFVELLHNVRATPLDMFFAVNPGWNNEALAPLSELVARWLHPQPEMRITRPRTEPIQLIALNELRAAVTDIRRRNPNCLGEEVGIAAFDVLPIRPTIDVASELSRSLSIGRQNQTLRLRPS